MMSPGEDWIELGQSKELISFAAHRIIYRCGHQGGTFSDDYRDPEEKGRAGFFVELVERYQYPPDRIDFEVEVPRREPKDKADIVIYRDDGLTTPYCVVECKQDGISEAEIEQAVKQAGGNANNLGAPYGMMVAGSVRVVFRAKEWDPKRPRESGNLGDLPARYGRAPKYRYWKQRQGWPDLAVVNESRLRDAFQQCHDILWEGGRRNPAEAFDEMSKLMFCKLQDERLRTGIGEAYAFQCGTDETADDVTGRVQAMYGEAQETAPSVFQRSIEAQPHLVYRVVQVLQGISLDRMDLDVKGAAFEKFLGVVFRGEMGQYFTHRNLVNFMVDVLEPNRRDKVIDPACGSGGFLLQAMDRVRRDAEARLTPANAYRAWHEWALYRLHGIEINEQISRVAMMGMIIHEDGHTNIKCTDALRVFDDINSLGDNITIQPASYTLLMTNPPFGAKVTRMRKGAEHPYLDTYELGGKVRRRNGQKTEILFIERCLQLLAPGGRMGIVVPDGILTNSSLQYVRDFIMREARVLAVVSLPQHTFVPAKSAVKASLLFLRKWKEGEDREQDYPIFMAMAEHVGYTATGKEDDNDLPAILDAYRQFKREHADFFLSNPLCFGAKRGEIIRLDPLTNDPDSRALRQAVQRSRFTVGKVGDICEEIHDGLHGARHYVQAGIPLLGVGNVTEEGLDLSEVNRIAAEEHSRLKRSQVCKGDVLVTITGRLGTAMVYPSDQDANLSAHVARIRVKPEHSAAYLAAYLNSSVGRHFISLHQIGSTHPHINVNRLRDVTLVVAPPSMQDAIADKMAAAYRRKRQLETEAKALLESVDGYVLGELGIELPEFKEERHFTQWARTVRPGRLNSEYYYPERMAALTAISQSRHAVRPLKAVAQFYRKSVVARQEAPDALYIGLQHIESNTGELFTDDLLHGQDIESRASVFEPQDVLFPRLRPYLNKVHLARFDGLCSTEFHVLRTRGNCHSAYLKEFLLTSVVVNQTKHMMTGNTLPRLQTSDIESLQIPVPPLQMQRKIAVEAQTRREHARALKEEAQRALAEAKAEVERMILGEN